MGLDATAYATATLTEPHEEAEECWDGDHVRAFIIAPAFHRSLRGLVADRCYAVKGREVDVHTRYGGHGMFGSSCPEPSLVWSRASSGAHRTITQIAHSSS